MHNKFEENNDTDCLLDIYIYVYILLEGKKESTKKAKELVWTCWMFRSHVPRCTLLWSVQVVWYCFVFPKMATCECERKQMDCGMQPGVFPCLVTSSPRFEPLVSPILDMLLTGQLSAKFIQIPCKSTCSSAFMPLLLSTPQWKGPYSNVPMSTWLSCCTMRPSWHWGNVRWRQRLGTATVHHVWQAKSLYSWDHSTRGTRARNSSKMFVGRCGCKFLVNPQIGVWIGKTWSWSWGYSFYQTYELWLRLKKHVLVTPAELSSQPK